MSNVSPSNSHKGNSPALRFRDFFDAWVRYSLSEIAEINPTTKTLPNDFYYIDLESVVKGNLIKDISIHKSNAPSRAQRLVTTNDILFQTVRPYQQNNYIFEKERDLPTVASTGYAQIRTNENPYFLYALLHTKTFLDEVMTRCTGSSYPAINCNDLGEIYVTIPTKKEQDCIAKFIKLIDSRINAQDKLLTFLKSYKRGALRHIFASIKTTVPLHKICEYCSSANTMSIIENTSSGTYPVYDASGIVAKINKFDFNDAYVAIIKDGSGVGKLQLCEPNSSIIGTLGALFPKNCTVGYLYAVLQTIDYRQFVTGMAIPHIYYKDYKNIEVPFPDDILRTNIEQLLKGIDAIIDKESRLLILLQLQKASLLQSLFI